MTFRHALYTEAETFRMQVRRAQTQLSTQGRADVLETMLMGRLMGVDPFNQPGVEEGKVLARQYLAEG